MIVTLLLCEVDIISSIGSGDQHNTWGRGVPVDTIYDTVIKGN